MVNNIKKTAVILVALMLCLSFLPVFTNTVEAQTGTQPPTFVYPSSGTNVYDFNHFEAPSPTSGTNYNSASIDSRTGIAFLTDTGAGSEGFISSKDTDLYDLANNNFDFVYTVSTGRYAFR